MRATSNGRLGRLESLNTSHARWFLFPGRPPAKSLHRSLGWWEPIAAAPITKCNPVSWSLPLQRWRQQTLILLSRPPARRTTVYRLWFIVLVLVLVRPSHMLCLILHFNGFIISFVFFLNTEIYTCLDATAAPSFWCSATLPPVSTGGAKIYTIKMLPILYATTLTPF